MLGLRFCVRAFSSCGKWGPLFIAVHGPLTIVASLVAEHRLQTRRLSSCGARAQLLRGMWDLPRPGLEPVSPALAGRLSTTAPPGKPPTHIFDLPLRSHSALDLCALSPGPELLSPPAQKASSQHRAGCHPLLPVPYPHISTYPSDLSSRAVPLGKPSPNPDAVKPLAGGPAT